MWLRHLVGRVEVPLLLLYFCYMLSDAVTYNFIMNRTCHVTLGYNASICSELGTGKNTTELDELEKVVQPHGSVLFTTQAAVAAVVPAVLCLFIGPWIDKYGRKPVVVSVMCGNLVTYVILMVLSVLPEASPWWWMTTAVATSLGGGESCLLMAAVCYISDTTTDTMRGVRLGLMEAYLSLGVILGLTASSYTFDAVGFLGTYGACTACCTCALLYTVFLLPESVDTHGIRGSLGDLFHWQRLREMWYTCVRTRPGVQRTVLWLLLGTLMLYMLAVNADSQIIFLYLREKFRWSLQQYTLFNSVSTVVGVAAGIFQLWVVHRLLRVPDAPLVLFGFATLFVGAILYGTVTTSIGIYVGGAIKCLAGVTRPLLKSKISKIVKSEELGQILTLSTAVESVSPVVTSPLYTIVYNKTLYTCSGAFNYITAAVHGVNVIVLISAMVLMKKDSKD